LFFLAVYAESATEREIERGRECEIGRVRVEQRVRLREKRNREREAEIERDKERCREEDPTPGSLDFSTNHGGSEQRTPAMLFPEGQVLFRLNPATREPREPERPESP
jgi:hypothetical protein